MLRRLTSTSASWATVPLRLALGIAFIGHGAQKVLGSFNGPGFAKFTSFPAPFPFMRPGWLWMGAAAVSELVGGILVLLRVLGEKLVRNEGAIRRSRDDIGEGSATVNPELPATFLLSHFGIDGYGTTLHF